jgi:hypothetical protein
MIRGYFVLSNGEIIYIESNAMKDFKVAKNATWHFILIPIGNADRIAYRRKFRRGLVEDPRYIHYSGRPYVFKQHLTINREKLLKALTNALLGIDPNSEFGIKLHQNGIIYDIETDKYIVSIRFNGFSISIRNSRQRIVRAKDPSFILPYTHETVLSRDRIIAFINRVVLNDTRALNIYGHPRIRREFLDYRPDEYRINTYRLMLPQAKK